MFDPREFHLIAGLVYNPMSAAAVIRIITTNINCRFFLTCIIDPGGLGNEGSTCMKKHFFIFVVAAVALVSCPNEPRGNFNRATFNRERQLWLEQGIQNYSFCLDTGSMSIRKSAIMYVKDGVCAYIQIEGIDDVPVPVEEQYYLSPELSQKKSISDVYTKIERVVDQAGYRDTVEIQYDSEWHYPKEFQCDWASGNFWLMTITRFIVDPEYP
jgi:hypothetical protein